VSGGTFRQNDNESQIPFLGHGDGIVAHAPVIVGFEFINLGHFFLQEYYRWMYLTPGRPDNYLFN
jgi:hypothetical protein